LSTVRLVVGVLLTVGGSMLFAGQLLPALLPGRP
jgi:hypothetical protein